MRTTKGWSTPRLDVEQQPSRLERLRPKHLNERLSPMNSLTLAESASGGPLTDRPKGLRRAFPEAER